MNTKTITGAIVQTVSIICPSRMNRLVCLFWIIIIIVFTFENGRVNLSRNFCK